MDKLLNVWPERESVLYVLREGSKFIKWLKIKQGENVTDASSSAALEYKIVQGLPASANIKVGMK